MYLTGRESRNVSPPCCYAYVGASYPVGNQQCCYGICAFQRQLAPFGFWALARISDALKYPVLGHTPFLLVF